MSEEFGWLVEKGERGQLEVFLVPDREGEGQDVVLRIDGTFDPSYAQEYADWWCEQLGEKGLRVRRSSIRDAGAPKAKGEAAGEGAKESQAKESRLAKLARALRP